MSRFAHSFRLPPIGEVVVHEIFTHNLVRAQWYPNGTRVFAAANAEEQLEAVILDWVRERERRLEARKGKE